MIKRIVSVGLLVLGISPQVANCATGKYCKEYFAPPSYNRCNGEGSDCTGSCATIDQQGSGGTCVDGSLSCTTQNDLAVIVVTTYITGCSDSGSGCGCAGTPTSSTTTIQPDCG